MHYKFYSTEDFIQDEFFQQWVFAPNEESNQYWTTFLLHYPDQRGKLEEAKEFIQAMKFENVVPESLVEMIKSDFNIVIDQFEAARKESGPAPMLERAPKVGGNMFFLKLFFPVAASILIALVSIEYLVIQKGSPHNAQRTHLLQEQKTPKGKRQHIVLEDSTNVWLNANSTLRYARNFSEKNNREVYLEGEAFFEVSENVAKPFIVHTSGLAIKVLGTAFNVRSYDNDHVVETTLVRGKVSITSAAEDSIHQVTLLPNQQALFSKDSRTISLEKAVDPENYIAWKNGWMIFDDKPFSYIKETLERWYNVTIVMEEESSLTCAFSARFKDKTLQEVLEIFKNTESINYRIAGDRVLIEGKLCRE